MPAGRCTIHQDYSSHFDNDQCNLLLCSRMMEFDAPGDADYDRDHDLRSGGEIPARVSYIWLSDFETRPVSS